MQRRSPTHRPVAAVLALVLVGVAALGRSPSVGATRAHLDARAAATTQITAHDGKFWAGSAAVVLRGFDVSPGITTSDLNQISGWGFNFIRLRFRFSDLEPAAPVHNGNGTWTETYDPAYVQSLKDTISAAKSKGLYVMLSNSNCSAGPPDCPYFGWPGWQFQAAYNSHAITYPENEVGLGVEETDFWSDDLRKKWETDMWTYMAGQFKGVGGIAGYEVRNEPQGGNLAATPATTQLIVDYQLAVATVIRGADPARIVFFTTRLGFGPGVTLVDLTGFKNLGNVAFDLHDYFGARWGDGLLENPKLPSFEQAYQDLFNHRLADLAPTYIGTTLSHERFVSLEANSLATKWGIPLVVGEIGDDGSLDPGVYAYFGTTVAAFNHLGVSWAAFYGEDHLGIIDQSTGALEPWGSIVVAGAHG